jgi:D-tyrosyl-tRNA(Tyr) deacylase
MKVVIQRVTEASVSIQNQLHASIGKGMMILVGIQEDDSQEDINWLVSKICNLRIFDDENGIMNLSIHDVKGEILAISQFTLMARTKKGNRPSYIDAAKPEISTPLYEKFIHCLQVEMQQEIKTGIFGADMKVHLINDGPVTIIIDTHNKH